MRKIYQLAWFLIGASTLAQTQNQQIKLDMPVILPPSPTVAALMKFEEVPVSNYTGVPDISIPLFSSPTRSKDISLDISLKYHPSSIIKDEHAGDAGLGWSLFAGGSISRTVRGMPDELKDIAGSKMGIYHNSVDNHRNNYYEVFGLLNQANNTAEDDILSEYLWNVQVRGKFDTEHDLWQYNFMGHSGRFYIAKNVSGQLEVKGLDDDRLKIYNTYNAGDYKPLSFTIYDEKGYTYLFDIIEQTESHLMMFSTSHQNAEDLGFSMTRELIYNSAFMLTKVSDCQGNVLLDLKYRTEPMVEKIIDITNTRSNDFGLVAPYFNMISSNGQAAVSNFNPLPASTGITNQATTKVKKLSEILVDGIARVQFGFEKLIPTDEKYSIKNITIMDWKGNLIKKTEMTQADGKLSKVSIGNPIDSKKEDYILSYKNIQEPDLSPISHIISTDYWGYSNIVPEFRWDNERSTTPSFCTQGILQKMTIPTGGCVVFDFEANQYSFIGDTEITDFKGNPDNWNPQHSETVVSNIGIMNNFFTLGTAQEVFFMASLNAGSYYVDPALGLFQSLDIYLINASGEYKVGGFSFPECYNRDCKNSIYLYPGVYKVKFVNFDRNFPSVFSSSITAFYRTPSLAGKKYLYGGGNRIKRIGYFEDSSISAEDYTAGSGSPHPLREKHYQYYSFSDPSKSSGSLVFGLPIFEYAEIKRECFWLNGRSGSPMLLNDTKSFSYDMITSFNNLKSLRTQGSDVGYQNVTVSETGNGRTEYVFTSPIDVPEDMTFSLRPPFMPSANLEHKRGQVKSERIFDASGKIQKEQFSIYTYDDYTAVTGFRTYYPNGQFVQGLNRYIDYSSYKANTLECLEFGTNCFCNSGLAQEFINYKLIKESFGWAKLSSRKTKSYFYDGSNVKTVESSESYTYNTLNKQVATSTVTDSLHVTEQRYYYHAGNSPTSQNRISEIERVEGYRDGALVSNAKITYSNAMTPGQSWMPQSISSAKGTQALEGKVRYNAYDNYGNPLEMQQEDGTKTSYIWGYSKTQPIAKLENLAYSSIPLATVTALQLKSDTGTEAELLAELASLRGSFPNALVTAYTYKPLVGVSTATDPKGMKTAYEYDAFGRLKAVRDNNGNLLSENEYRYRTQN